MVRGADCEQSLIIGLSGEITANCLPAKLASVMSAGEQNTHLVPGLLWKLFSGILGELFQCRCVRCVCVSVKRWIQQVVSFYQVSGEASPSLTPVTELPARPSAGDGDGWSLEPRFLFAPTTAQSDTSPDTTNCQPSFFTGCRSPSPKHPFICPPISRSVNPSFLLTKPIPSSVQN